MLSTRQYALAGIVSNSYLGNSVLCTYERLENDSQGLQEMFKNVVQRGRSERKAEAYAVGTLRP